MTRHLRQLAAGVLLTAAAAAAQPPAPQPAASAVAVPWANKLFAKENAPAVIVHDFGTAPKGTVLVHKMTFTNIYDVPVQIIDVRKSCSCLEAYPPPQLLQPHESAELTLTMNSDKFNGPNAQSFFITFGPQYVSTAVIQVKANSRADVAVTPGQVNFGVVARGTTPSQTVTVKYAGRQRDWKVLGAVVPAGPLDVKLEDARGLSPFGGAEYRLIVGLKADAPAGVLNESIQLKTNDPTAPVLAVSVAAVVQASVTASPTKLRFDEVKVGATSEQKVIVRGAKPFKVQPVADAGDGLTVEAFPAAAPVQVLTVKFAPTAAGRVARDLTISTDLGPAVVFVEAVGVAK